MPQTVRASLLLALLLVPAAGTLLAQTAGTGERLPVHKPSRPTTADEGKRKEALKLYALGVFQERKNRLVEATRNLEEARRLDPDSAAILKALIPLYLALDRVEDALAGCRQALALNPDDYETAYLYARQLRGLNRRKDAIEAFGKAAKCAGLKERPDLQAQIWFDLGGLYEQEANYAEAENSFRHVLEVLNDPKALLELGNTTNEDLATQTAETYERLGQACLKGSKVEKAIEAFELAQKKDPSRSARLAFNLAQVYEGQGKLREALAQVDAYLQTQPQGIEVYEKKIALQRKLGLNAEVLPELTKASKRDANNTGLRLLLAREWLKGGQAAEAEAIYNDLIRKAPNPDVYRGLFELYKADKRLGGGRALDLLDKALDRAAGEDKAPGSASDAASARAMLIACREDVVLVKMLLAASHRNLLMGKKLAYPTRAVLATLAARTRQLDLAEELYRGCLERPGGLREMEAEVYGGLLRVLRLRHKHAEIIEVCQQGLEKAQATNRVLFHREKAWAHAARGEMKEALESADTAVADAGAGQVLASKRVRLDILSAAGKHEQAITECQALLKEYNQGGDLRDVRATLSAVYSAAGKHELSEEQLHLILKSDPTDATANNDLGYQWAERNKNLAEAEKLIRKALDLDRKQRTSGLAWSADSDRDNAAYLDSLGWVYFRRGKLEDARRVLERASTLPGGDDDPVVWDHLGDVYFRLDLRERAGEAWKKALGLYEAGARRKSEERYKEIQEKLGLMKPER